MKLELRDYQDKLIEDIRASYRKGNKNVLAVLPTGGGKTVVFSYISGNAASNKKRILVLVHREELLLQSYEAMCRTGIRTGLVSPDYTPDYKAPIQVGMVNTVKNRLNRFDHFDLIVIDEGHHAVASTWRTIVDHFSTARVLMVTATPVRGDGKGLGIEDGGLAEDMVEGPQIQVLIDEGYLVQPRVFRPKSNIDLSKVRRKGNDYDPTQLTEVMDKPKITGDAISHYRRYADGQPCVVFCVSVAHATHVAAEFREAGYRAVALDGNIDKHIRKDTLKGLADGRVQVVTSCDIISEGTDIPAIACAILLRPTQSEGLYLQQVGRALRPMYAMGFPVKTREQRLAAILAGPKPNGAVILDHVGNTLPTKHGMPTIYRHWSLKGDEMMESRKSSGGGKALSIVTCSSCFMAYERNLGKCPECGHVEVPKQKNKPLKYEEGELQEIIMDERQIAEDMVRKEQATMFKLRSVAKKRGWGETWVQKRLQEWRQKNGYHVEVSVPDIATLPDHSQQLPAYMYDLLV